MCAQSPAVPNVGKSSARGRRERVACHARVSSELWLINTDLGAGKGRVGTEVSPQNHHCFLEESQHHVIDPANSRGAFHDGVEHRLHIGGRAADDAEHLGRRGLMLQGLAQFGVALLQFVEQADVLDGDDRLRSECLKQFDCFP